MRLKRQEREGNPSVLTPTYIFMVCSHMKITFLQCTKKNQSLKKDSLQRREVGRRTCKVITDFYKISSTVPTMVKRLRVLDTTNTSIQLVWEEPEHLYGILLHYVIEYEVIYI